MQCGLISGIKTCSETIMKLKWPNSNVATSPIFDGDEKMNYEKIQFEREIIDVVHVRSSYI
jgi:hypothetical protein